MNSLAARVMTARLDRELAAGRPPGWSGPSMARADRLVSPPFRAALADDWDRVPRLPARPRWLLRRDAVAAAEPAIRLLTARLRAPRPVTARGVALANELLTDGTGPLYNPASAVPLAAALAEAAALLDPATPLISRLTTRLAPSLTRRVSGWRRSRAAGQRRRWSAGWPAGAARRRSPAARSTR
jgi:hypothetical protein